jgi:hypothetical protein
MGEAMDTTKKRSWCLHALMRGMEQEDQRGFKNFEKTTIKIYIGATKSSFFM